MKIVDANKIPFLTTGGGHGISDYSPFKGIAIDLGNFKSVELNAFTDRLTIGGATEYSQLHDLLYDAGKELSMVCRLFSWSRENVQLIRPCRLL